MEENKNNLVEESYPGVNVTDTNFNNKSNEQNSKVVVLDTPNNTDTTNIKNIEKKENLDFSKNFNYSGIYNQDIQRQQQQNLMFGEHVKNDKKKNSKEISPIFGKDGNFTESVFSENKTFLEYEQVNFSFLETTLKVKVTDYNKTSDQDLLSSSYYVYSVECSNFNSKVYRRYNDFLWLRQTLRKYYPGLHIPPIPSKSVMGKLMDDEFHMKRVRGFNKFFDHLSKQKILSSSIITKDFLTEVIANEFVRKKNNYSNFQPDSQSFVSKINENDFSEETINNNHKSIAIMRGSLKSISLNLNELQSEFGKLQGDLKQVAERLSNISKLTNHITQQQKTSPEFFTDTETNYYSKMTDFTKKWSESYISQLDFFKENFQEFFGQFKIEYESFDELINDYFVSKNTYMDYKTDLTKKKEKFYKLQNVDRWDLSNGDILNKESFLGNKDECMKKMLRSETKELEVMELKYYFMNHQVIHQYMKLRKYLVSLLTSQNKNMITNNKNLIGDICFVMKLVTMNI